MIVAGSTEEKVVRQLNMSWGVTPVLIKEKEHFLSFLITQWKLQRKKA